MKKLISLFALTSSLAFAADECPDLNGSYHCTFNNNTQYSLLIIERVQVAEDLYNYSFDYTAIPGEPEVIPASSTGMPDGWGWTTRCANNTLRSIPHDASMMQEMYLDKEKAFVRGLNGKIVQRCPRKH